MAFRYVPELTQEFDQSICRSSKCIDQERNERSKLFVAHVSSQSYQPYKLKQRSNINP